MSARPMHAHRTPSRQRGMTILEMTIAMALGLLLLLGLSSLFVQSKRSFKQDELVSRMQEDARFAVTELQHDIALSGFWASVLDPSPIVNDSAALVGELYTYTTTATTPASSLAIEVFDGVDGTETPLGDATIDNLVPGTDVIAIRKLAGVKAASASTTADIAAATAQLTNGSVYLRTNGVVARMAVKADHPVNGAAANAAVVPVAFDYWEYEPVVYFVRDYYTAEKDGIPTLCRQVLSGTALTTECLAAGVEDLQFEYGIDTDADNYADQYVAAPTTAQMTKVTSVRVFLLMRATEPDRNYTNNKTYTLSNSKIAPAAPGDGYYRRVFSTTVMVRNNAHLMALGG